MGLRKALREQVREWQDVAEAAGARVPEGGPDDMSSQEDDTMGEVYAEAAAAVLRILGEHPKAQP